MPHNTRKIYHNVYASWNTTYELNAKNPKTSWYDLNDSQQAWIWLYHKNLPEMPDPQSEGFSNEITEVETWLEFSNGQPLGQLDGGLDFADLEEGAVRVVDNRQHPALGIHASLDRLEPYQGIRARHHTNGFIRIVMGPGRPGSRVRVAMQG